MSDLGVMQLLRPLLLDIVPTVQQTAALALGKLANHNDDLAEAVVKGDILPQLVYSLAEQNVMCCMLDIGCVKLSFAEVLQKSCCICIESCCEALSRVGTGDQSHTS